MTEVNPILIEEIKRYGAFDVTACYSCGVCTAICPLVEEGREFPRRMIRYALLGIRRKLFGSPELWLCYYCGECTSSCPRQADPGGFMMAARRYAIAEYSFGRIAKIFYSKIGAPLTFIVLTLIAGLLMILFGGNPNMSSADIFSLLSRETIHHAGIAVGIIVLLGALVNLAMMYRHLSQNSVKVGGLSGLIRVLIKEVAYQGRYVKCESRSRFLTHMSLFWGFLLLFLASGVNFVSGTRSPIAIVIGFVGGIFLLVGGIYFVAKRAERREPFASYSDFMDWAFLALILLVGVTGFLLDFALVTNLPLMAYTMFSMHLIAAFDLLIAAPFTKFAHAVYRPLALWMSERV